VLIALVVLLVFTNAGFLVFLDRQTRRHAHQVAELCQRVQAPQLATVEHHALSLPPEEPDETEPEYPGSA
jgi:hypothetical protein